jgi:16S rRNA (cytosine967-C5)-methyltransferase
MTPGARAAAAIGVLDAIGAGVAAEMALQSWARGARYAGSKDRAAVRDHVFDVLRRWRSSAAMGGGATGRCRMIGALRLQGVDPATLFTGDGHAPGPLTATEQQADASPSTQDMRDLPDWLWPHFQASLQKQAAPAAEALRHRAPVMLRVNRRFCTVDEARSRLAAEGIATLQIDIARNALQVTEGDRKVAQSSPYLQGLVELQDGSSQAAMEQLDIPNGARVLDYCAGGGGKLLAMASCTDGTWFAHDSAPERMKDLPPRAARAGIEATLLRSSDLADSAPFDLVLCDVPCTGSGTWRRTPEAKWRLSPERLAELGRIQGEILRQAAGLVAPEGCLAYATCSVLEAENQAVIDAFSRHHPAWNPVYTRHWPISPSGDGFFLAKLYRRRDRGQRS